jgi:hypothetical protein
MMKKSTSQQGILGEVLSRMEKAREEKLGDPFDLGITGLQIPELQSLELAIKDRLEKKPQDGELAGRLRVLLEVVAAKIKDREVWNALMGRGGSEQRN